MNMRIAVLAVALPMAICAQNSEAGLFAGTWKLNVAKSRYDPGPPPKSETVTISSDGKVDVVSIDSAGKRIEWSVVLKNGVTSPVNGLNAKVTHKQLNDHTTVDDWNFGDFSQVGKALLSTNGKVITYDLSGRDASGRAVQNVEIFDRQ
ncbi:MAG TPA: hypothetical protein VFB14_28500 [Bryobacteraceae bacterium]|jgi:hypothetical protein|nr:hypothetical protein [Bryobacteraceae bacterium]